VTQLHQRAITQCQSSIGGDPVQTPIFTTRCRIQTEEIASENLVKLLKNMGRAWYRKTTTRNIRTINRWADGLNKKITMMFTIRWLRSPKTLTASGKDKLAFSPMGAQRRQKVGGLSRVKFWTLFHRWVYLLILVLYLIIINIDRLLNKWWTDVNCEFVEYEIHRST